MIQDWKNKNNILLAVGILALTFLTYQFAIKNTIAAYETNKRLKTSLMSNSVEFLPADFMQRKDRNLKKILGKYSLDPVTFKGKSIGEVASIAERENLKLIEIPVLDPFYNTEKFLIQRMDFEGDFYSIVRFIQRIQNEQKVGVLKSLSLKTEMNGIEQGKKLSLEIFLQIKK